MRDFEDRLRTDLHAEVAGIDAPPFPDPARLRNKQIVNVVAAMAAIAIIVVGAVTVLGSSIGDGPIDVAARQGDPRGSGGTYPCKHRELEGTCIAHGEYKGTGWWIGAYVEDGEVCLSNLQVEPTGLFGGGTSCGRQELGPIDLGIDMGGSDFGIATGEVSPAVDRLVLEEGERQPLELQLYPAPKGLPEGLRMYNVFLGPDSTAVVAYDKYGYEIDREEIERDPAMMRYLEEQMKKGRERVRHLEKQMKKGRNS